MAPTRQEYPQLAAARALLAALEAVQLHAIALVPALNDYHTKASIVRVVDAVHAARREAQELTRRLEAAPGKETA